MNIHKEDFSLEEFQNGSVCLNCGKGAERDLVFVSGALRGDPDLEKQREILEFIIRAIRCYEQINRNTSKCRLGD